MSKSKKFSEKTKVQDLTVAQLREVIREETDFVIDEILIRMQQAQMVRIPDTLPPFRPLNQVFSN